MDNNIISFNNYRSKTDYQEYLKNLDNVGLIQEAEHLASSTQNSEKLQELIRKSANLIDEVQIRLGTPYSALKETLSHYKNELNGQTDLGNQRFL